MDKPTLTGEMLLLRPLTAHDVDAALEAVNDPEGRRLIGDAATYTRAQVQDWVTQVATAPGRIDLAITAHGSEEYRGEIALTDIDTQRSSARLRLRMAPGYRHRGYGTEAIELMLGLAFDGLGLHRVAIELLTINSRAQSIYDNVGFRVEGRVRDAFRDGDRWCDGVLMGMLEDEWRAGRGL